MFYDVLSQVKSLDSHLYCSQSVSKKPREPALESFVHNLQRRVILATTSEPQVENYEEHINLEGNVSFLSTTMTKF